MNRLIAKAKSALASELWPIPLLAVGAGLGLGIGLPILDAAIEERLSPVLAQYLFGGGPDAARAVLQTISGSLITVTSLTFSLTVVTLQLASSQFSPRLLRTFTSDRFVQATLALFLATFTYALTVLRTVRSEDSGGAAFVPQLSVTFSYVLAVASVLALVMFLSHLTREIRVETMMQRVSAETSAVINRLFGDEDAARLPGTDQPTAGSIRIESAESGFLISADDRGLIAAATASGAVIRIDSEVGGSVVRRTPFATAWPLDHVRRFTTDERDELSDSVNNAIGTGIERTNTQDAGYGFRQLVDVASKALSPGLNDPTTAVHVLGHLSALLCLLTERHTGPRVISDEDGRARVLLSRPSMGDLLSLSLSQIRQYGAKDPVVASRILRLLLEVAWCDRAHAHTVALRSELAQTIDAMHANSYSTSEGIRLDALAREVGDALER